MNALKSLVPSNEERQVCMYTECHLYIIGNQHSRIKGQFIDNAMASVLQGVKFGTGDLQNTE